MLSHSISMPFNSAGWVDQWPPDVPQPHDVGTDWKAGRVTATTEERFDFAVAFATERDQVAVVLAAQTHVSRVVNLKPRPGGSAREAQAAVTTRGRELGQPGRV
jgi:hypothetical protein